MFNRKQKAIEAFIAAKQHLARTQETSTQAQLAALDGIVHDRENHPASDTKARLEIEAEIRLAEAAAEVDRTCTDSNGLRASLAAAIEDYVAKRDQVVDPPTPTLADTDEARAEYERASKAYAEEVNATANERRRIVADGAGVFLRKLAEDRSDFVERASTALDLIKRELGEIEDPTPPVLGDATVPSVVLALTDALTAHRATVTDNAKKRKDLHEDFATTVTAIGDGFRQLSNRRRDAGLPSPEVFKSEPAIVGGYTNNLSRLLHDGAMLHNAIKALGSPPANVDGLRHRLRELDAKRERFEARQAHKASEAKGFAATVPGSVGRAR